MKRHGNGASSQESSPGSLSHTAPPRAWHALTPEGALASLASHAERGLTASEARTRLARHGPNVLQRNQGPSVLTLLWRQINSPIVYLLLGSAALAMALGKVLDGAVVSAPWWSMP